VGCVGLAILLTMANLSVTLLFNWDLGKVSVEFGLSAVAFTGLLLVFFLGMKILVDDLERSHIFMIMSRPVTIHQYLIGKYIGLAIILLITTLILSISATLSMQYVLMKYPSFVPPNFSWLTFSMAMCCQFVALLMVLALSFVCFCFASESFVALLLAIFSYFVGQNMELLRRVIAENPYSLEISGQKQLVTALSWIFPNLSLFDKKYIAAYGLAFSAKEFFFLCLYGISYSMLLLYIAAWLFRRKELA